MYQIGDRVVYGIHGVCQVTGHEKQMENRKEVVYLILEPLGQEGSRYLVPSHNPVAMSKLHPMLTPEELDALVQSEDVQRDGWIREENQRKQIYRELISSGDRAGILRMIRALYAHKKTQQNSGKKVHMADENFLRDAEKRMAGEIAVVLDVPNDQARAYLRSRLKFE